MMNSSSLLTMQQTLPLRDNWLITSAATSSPAPPVSAAATDEGHVSNHTSEELKKLLSENAVVVLARRGCCMCHVLKLLLHGHGVNPTILEVEDGNESVVIDELEKIAPAGKQALPAVVVGGELFGGLEDVMGAHISGELVPRLRKAGALWL